MSQDTIWDDNQARLPRRYL